MAAPPPVLTLAVNKGPRKGETRQCRAGTVLRVGRVVRGNDLAVRDVGASQQHLAIEFLPPPAARWAVSDLASSNGSLLNGAPLVPSVPALLSHGDLIKIGESTVLTVSISSDSDPNPGATAKPGLRRSSRQVAASVVVEEEKLLAVTGRGTRKKALAAPAAAPEIPEAVNEEPEAAAPVLEEEKSRAITHQGGRKKAASAEPQEKMEEDAEAHRRGGRKKAGEPPQQEKDKEEEAAVMTRRGGRKKAAEPPEPEREEEDKEEEAPAVTRRARRKKAAEPPEPEKEDEGKEKETLVEMRRGGRKKYVATVAPPPLPPSTRSTRYRGRSTKQAVLEDEDMEEQEQNKKDVDKKAAPSERTGNPSTSTTVMSSEEEKGGKVAVGHGEVEVIAAFDEEFPNGRASSQLAPPDNGGDEENGSREEEEEENGKAALIGSGGNVADREKVQECAQRISLETMTLREWFERMEKYLPRMINEAADEMIANLEERHQHILEYISTLRD